MIVAIIGARNRDSRKDYDLVERAFLDWWGISGSTRDIIISGGAKTGADRFAGIISKKLGLEFNDSDYKPNYNLGFNECYFERNRRIAEDANVMIACIDPTRAKNRGGTNYTINKFQEYHPSGKLIIV
jgi:hypothetical protein